MSRKIAAPPKALRPGSDFRLRGFRREVFLRFYLFHLRHRAHPGCVYFALPALAEARSWDGEQRAWAAFLNANTQNPVTTSLLMSVADHPRKSAKLLAYWKENYTRLAWDTDRRHHKSQLDLAVAGYKELTRKGQERYWRDAAAYGWPGVWEAATAIPTLGRLSAWSYAEYLRILLGDLPDADHLMLDDRAGSRSHRNGLLLVLGRDELMWWKPNPTFNGVYPRELLEEINAESFRLLDDARARATGSSRKDVGFLTMESALCTYKSWHRPRRRYPGVYADMMYDRLRHAERIHGHQFGELWDARKKALPKILRLEDNPNDPGCVPAKQNWYLETGEVIQMHEDHPEFANGFSKNVDAVMYGRRKD